MRPHARGEASLDQSGNEIITVTDLSKHFGELKAVDGVSFSVMKGEVLGILGPNGAGKTTILECIEGILTPTSGTTTVFGIDTQRDPNRMKQRIGVQLQASAYFDFLTLTEILDLFGLFYDRRVPPGELLAKVGLEDKAGSTVDQLSGGQQQRFTIAAALVNDPDVVFLDEPTAGLDPQARRNLWDFIKNMNGDGRTVVLTTHYLEEAEFLCHRVAIMDNGRIVALDTPDKLIQRLPNPYEIMLKTVNGDYPDGLEELAAVNDVVCSGDGVIQVRSSDAASTMPALMRWVADRGVALIHLEVIPATLEDVFLALTGRAFRD